MFLGQMKNINFFWANKILYRFDNKITFNHVNFLTLLIFHSQLILLRSNKLLSTIGVHKYFTLMCACSVYFLSFFMISQKHFIYSLLIMLLFKVMFIWYFDFRKLDTTLFAAESFEDLSNDISLKNIDEEFLVRSKSTSDSYDNDGN